MSNVYLTAAFKCTRPTQAYFFMINEYVFEDFAPGSVNDKILYGPARTSDFPSLRNTIFGDRIDCSFGSHDEGIAYIFAWNNCAKWSYPSDATFENNIVEGPMPIATMFPCLKGTVFENGVDVAFESSVQYEAYLFKDDRYARINYGPQNPRLMAYHPIRQYWPVFRGTIFENGSFDAALTSHRENEAYIFKGDSYVLIRFIPGTCNDELIGGVKIIEQYWKGLGSVLPRSGAAVADLEGGEPYLTKFMKNFFRVIYQN